jgi:hypothetical protein
MDEQGRQVVRERMYVHLLDGTATPGNDVPGPGFDCHIHLFQLFCSAGLLVQFPGEARAWAQTIEEEAFKAAQDEMRYFETISRRLATLASTPPSELAGLPATAPAPSASGTTSLFSCNRPQTRERSMVAHLAAGSPIHSFCSRGQPLPRNCLAHCVVTAEDEAQQPPQKKKNLGRRPNPKRPDKVPIAFILPAPVATRPVSQQAPRDRAVPKDLWLQVIFYLSQTNQ